MSRKKNKKRRVVQAIPCRTREEAGEIVGRIGDILRKIEARERDLNDQIEILRQQAVGETKPLQEKLDCLTIGLFAFAESHRSELLPKDQKSLTVPAGSYGWRSGPPFLEFFVSEESIVHQLEELKESDAVRVSKEVDKRFLLAHRDILKKLRGVIKTQHEFFFVSIAESKLRNETSVLELRDIIILQK